MYQSCNPKIVSDGRKKGQDFLPPCHFQVSSPYKCHKGIYFRNFTMNLGDSSTITMPSHFGDVLVLWTAISNNSGTLPALGTAVNFGTFLAVDLRHLSPFWLLGGVSCVQS